MRYGNKSVISDIRKKEDMPFYYDANGNKVHVQLILSVLAIINRKLLCGFKTSLIAGNSLIRQSAAKTLKL